MDLIGQRAAGLLVALTAALAPGLGAAQPPPAGAAPRVLYHCRSNTANLGGDPGTLTLEKTFFEDGSAQPPSILWEDHNGSFVRRLAPGVRAMATLRWPGRHRVAHPPEPFSWARGSIQVVLLSSDPTRWRFGRQERWGQIVVDRDRSAIVYDHDGVRQLLLSGLDLQLASDLRDFPAGRLHMSIDALLAWGTGTESVTVYETVVSYRRPRRNSSPTSPAGQRRIIGQYDIDTAALAAKVTQIREAARVWEAGLTDFRTSCERGLEETGRDIIITTR